MRESDLSLPTVKYFEEQNYIVNCEVKGIDVIARRDEYLIAIEMKLSFNMTLLFQVMERQKFADEVYIALPRPKRRSKDLTKMRRLAELLNFGILFVEIEPVPYAEAFYIPESKDKPRDNKRKRQASKEASGRSIELNRGGVRRMKIITAYREKCLSVASIMHIKGSVTAKVLRDEYSFDKTILQVLKRDYYKWFENVDGDNFRLSEKGKVEIETSPEFKRLFEAYNDIYLKRQ